MWNGRPPQRDLDQILLRGLDALLNGRRHFLRLADAEAHHAMPVANDDQRAEAQVLAALDDLRHAIDRDDGVLDLELRRIDLLTRPIHQCHFRQSFPNLLRAAPLSRSEMPRSAAGSRSNEGC